MPLTLLPLNLPGRVYRSPMPFSRFDMTRSLFQEFMENDVSVVVMLVDSEESLLRAGLDLKPVYENEGWKVISLPTQDYSAPTDIDKMRAAVDDALAEAQAGRNLVVHCYAGLGRTGMFAACLARRALGLSPEEAVTWVRRHIPGAVEDDRQIDAVRNL